MSTERFQKTVSINLEKGPEGYWDENGQVVPGTEAIVAPEGSLAELIFEVKGVSTSEERTADYPGGEYSDWHVTFVGVITEGDLVHQLPNDVSMAYYDEIDKDLNG